MKKILFLIIMASHLFLLHADKKGEEIALKNFNLPESKDSSSVTIMALIDRQGERQIRKIESYSKQGPNGRDSFMHFIEPGDVKGTTFLIKGYKNGDDEQHLYLPGLGKVRKISASNKDQKFMGSDLTFYDMEEHDFNDFTYQYLRDEVYNDMNCHVIEMKSTDKYSPYSKQIAWINSQDYFIYKLECYDKKRDTIKVKTIASLDVKNFDGVLIPQRMVVDNHRDNHKTLLQDTNIKVNQGLSSDMFTIHHMM